MPIKAPAVVTGRDGRPLGVIEHPEFVESGTDETVSIHLEDGRTLQARRDLLTLKADGGYFLDLDLDLNLTSEEDVVVPLVEESVEVAKRVVESGKVRVRKTVKTTEQIVDEPVMREEVTVERVVLNRPIDAPVGPRQEGDTLIVPLLEEILVVEKRLILREEVRITRRKVEERSQQTVTLRSEQAEVERSEGST